MALVKRFMRANKLLEPIRSADYYGIKPKTLEESLPIFRAIWVFKDPHAPSNTVAVKPVHRQTGRPVLPQSAQDSSGDISLYIVAKVEWTEDENGDMEMSQATYYRPRRNSLAPREDMDLKLIELGQ